MPVEKKKLFLGALLDSNLAPIWDSLDKGKKSLLQSYPTNLQEYAIKDTRYLGKPSDDALSSYDTLSSMKQHIESLIHSITPTKIPIFILPYE